MESYYISKQIQLINEILECWPDFDMSLDELLNPTMNTAKKFYEKFLHEFGIKQDHIIELINRNFHEHLEFDDIIYMYVIYSCVNRIYQHIDFTSTYSFALTNVLNPTDTNFTIHVSLFVNYIHYVKEKEVHNILPLKKKVLESVDAFEELHKTTNSLNEHLKYLTNTRTMLIEKLQKLKENNIGFKDCLTEPQLKSEQLAKKIQILKDELNLLEEENEQLDHQYDEDQNVAEEPSESRTDSELYLLKIKEEVNKLNETLNLQKILDTYRIIEEHRSEKEIIIKEINAAHEIDNEIRNTLLWLNTEITEMEIKIEATDKEWREINDNMGSEIKLKTSEYEIVQKVFDIKMFDAAEMNKSIESFSKLCDECREAIEEDIKYYEKLYKEYFNARCSLDTKLLTVLALIKKEVKLKKSD